MRKQVQDVLYGSQRNEPLRMGGNAGDHAMSPAMDMVDL